MDGHLAIGAHIDIDAPALALGGLLIFPCREMLAGRDDHRIGPSGLDTGIPLRRDRGILRGPEGIGIAEIAILAEQVGDDALHRSEEHTSELQSLMRNSYAVFC